MTKVASEHMIGPTSNLSEVSMAYNFLPYDERQNFLLPPSILEWVREDSLECFVSELIDQLEAEGRLSAFYENYRGDGWGRAAYHPRMLVKVLVCAYCRGITGSRRIAQALESEVIVAEDVTQEENDKKQLGPMLDRCDEQAGQRPQQVLADAGYWSEDNARLEDERTELSSRSLARW